jgi:hypothetical protein
MAKYRKKPVVIEAMQWDGTRACKELIEETLYDLETNNVELPMEGEWDGTTYLSWTIYTLEGLITASPGDWIVRGVKGEHYPCKPDIFEATYEAVDE